MLPCPPYLCRTAFQTLRPCAIYRLTSVRAAKWSQAGRLAPSASGTASRLRVRFIMLFITGTFITVFSYFSRNVSPICMNEEKNTDQICQIFSIEAVTSWSSCPVGPRDREQAPGPRHRPPLQRDARASVPASRGGIRRRPGRRVPDAPAGEETSGTRQSPRVSGGIRKFEGIPENVRR